MTNVRLTSDIEMTVSGNFEDVLQSFKTALAHRVPWEIHAPDGHGIALNPHHVLFIESDTAP